MHRGIDEASELLATAVRHRPDELSRSSIRRILNSDVVGEVHEVGGRLITDAAQRDTLVQRWSAPWNVAWHALEILDYDLTGELEA